MKYAFISGASSGLAKAAIQKLTENNYIVFCADIVYNENKVENNIHYIKMDITKNEDIDSAYDYVKSITDKVDIISNFAGIVTLGSLVELPENSLDKIININLIGTYKINNKFFPLVKNAKGRIINISSEYGKICGIPFHGYYGISKHAIEVYNDSLRRELLSSGVKVICIRPGAFKTKMQAGITKQFDEMVNDTKMYKEPLLKMQKIMTIELNKAKSTEIFASKYIKIVLSKRPKKYYNVCNSIKMKMLSALPSGMQDWIFYKFLKTKNKNWLSKIRYRRNLWYIP